MIILNEVISDAKLGELCLMVSFDEKTTPISEQFRAQLQDARKASFDSLRQALILVDSNRPMHGNNFAGDCEKDFPYNRTQLLRSY